MRAGILYIVSSLKSGGTETQLVEILKGLDRDRFRPLVACFRRTGGLLGAVESLGVEITEMGFDSLTSLRAARAFRETGAWARERGVRVIHGFHYHGGLYGALLKKRIPGSKLIVCEQGLIGLTDVRELRNRIGRWLYYRRADLLLSNCLAVRDAVAERDGIPAESIQVIYGGVDLGRFHPPVRPRSGRNGAGPVIGCVGRLHPDKGQLVLAEAAPEILGKLPEATIVLAGDGPQRAELEAAIARLGIAGRVKMLGDRRDVPDLLGGFDMIVLPSMNEGFANAALEGMACGVPVIASDAGGNKEVVVDGKTGRLFPRGNASALARCVVETAGDRPGADRMAAAALERVRREFGVDTLVRRHEEMYGDLAGDGESGTAHGAAGRRSA
ncbi:MAG TPA: glycosyltransferase [Candidatus Saccharimonadales bacterium]|nr:glycosyltransferase [Candidatus Saccharimonadales bacterium]